MEKKAERVRKKPIKSQRSQNTKKLSAFAPISKPSKFHEFAIVDGRSMWPTFRSGDTVAYRSIDFSQIHPGDIIVFQKPSQSGFRDLRIHRVIYRRAQWLLESGDNTDQAAFISTANVLGRVELVKRGKVWSKPKQHNLKRKQWLLLAGAAAYLEINQIKNKLIGDIKSERLWRWSGHYRKAFQSLGLDLPLLWPK